MTPPDAFDPAGVPDLRKVLARARGTSLAVALAGRVARSLSRLVPAVDRTARESRVAAAVAWFAHVTRESRVYRWFTAEPDPEVVVVDLRDTVTVGPVLAVLDAAVRTFARYRQSSKLSAASGRTADRVADAPVRALGVVVLAAVATDAALTLALGSFDAVDAALGVGLALLGVAGLGVDASLQELRGTRAARLLVRILEPPEPPERAERSDDGPDGEPRPRRDGGGRDDDAEDPRAR